MRKTTSIAAFPALERGIVGYLITHPEAYHAVAGDLPSEAYTDTACTMVWPILSAMAAQGQTWDAVMVTQRCLDAWPGRKMATEISSLVRDGAGSDVVLPQMAAEVRDAWVVRRLREAGVAIDGHYRAGMRVQDVIARSQDNLDRLRALIAGDKAASIRTILDDVYLAIRSGSRAMASVPTGLPTVDRMTGGIAPGALWVIGARPSTGKTALAVSVAMVAASSGVEVLMVTTETTRELLGLRILSYATGRATQELRAGQVDDDVVSGAIRSMPDTIRIWDAAVQVHDLISYAVRWGHEVGDRPKLLIVDYLELIAPSRGDSREREVSVAVEQLQALARRRRIPVLLLSQLSRAAEADTHGPRMTYLRYSGMIEQAADVVGLLWHPPAEDDGVIEMRVEKNRMTGQVFRVRLWLRKMESRIMELSADGGAAW